MKPDAWWLSSAQHTASVDRLRMELAAAHANAAAANIQFNRATDLARDLGSGHPDGNLALQQAAQDLNSSLTEYRNALQRFTDCVLGKAESA